jgi:hypothetical protein
MISDPAIVQLYPNPNSGNFVLFSHSADDGVVFEVFNLSGHMVYSTWLDLQKGSNSVSLSGKLEPGMYLLRLKYRDHSEQLKLLIQ